MVVDHLSVFETIPLARTCKNFYAVFRPIGIKQDVQEDGAISAWWACASGTAGTSEVLRLALQAGCSPDLQVECPYSYRGRQRCKLPLALICIMNSEDKTAHLKELLNAGLDIHSHSLLILLRVQTGSLGFLGLVRHPNMGAFLLAIGFQREINGELIWPRVPRGIIYSVTKRQAGRKVLTVLLDAGADPDKGPSHSSTTALALSLYRRDHDTARLLISRGAMLNPIASCMILLDAWHEEETRRLLSIYIPLGLGINDRCRFKGYTRLGVVLGDKYPAGVVKAYLDWGADPRQAYRRFDRVNAGQPPVTPLQNLFGEQFSFFQYPEVEAELVKLRIAKAKILLAAEGSSFPQPPPGYNSMLDWIVTSVPMDALEVAVRTLEPWMELMNSDDSTVAALARRLRLHQSAPSYLSRAGFLFGDPPLKERKQIIKLVASFLRRFRAPGFVKHGRPRRHRTQIDAD